jgi:AraC family transcriptional regulator, transcriptional activator of the genes for pyochelin and ferripyochelin receptors
LSRQFEQTSSAGAIAVTISISSQAYEELWQTANPNPQQVDSSDRWDTVWKVPSELGQGFQRVIEWQEGIELAIDDCQLHDNVLRQVEDHKHPIQFGFRLSGHCRSQDEAISPGWNWFCGSGLATGKWFERSAQQRFLEVNVHLAPELYQSFITTVNGEIPAELQHMFKQPNQLYYHRPGRITMAMQLALRQLLHCPYHGITKRMYLQGKILELLAMMVEQERDLQQEKLQPDCLKLDEVDRIHQARTVLLQRLENPPSLLELARLVGLNDYTLKRGFKQVFGKTVFGYLHDYRLEQAQQLLATGAMKVEEVAQIVGYGDLSAFGRAFRKKFGVSPRNYKLASRSGCY